MPVQPSPRINTDSRYPTAAEKQAALAFAASLSGRLKAVALAEKAEDAAAAAVSDALRARFPATNWPSESPFGRLLLRSAVAAMLFDAPELLGERAGDWVASLSAGYDWPEGHADESRTALVAALSRLLPSDTATVLVPYLNGSATGGILGLRRLAHGDSPYPDARAREAVSAYARSLPARVDCITRVEAAEDAIVSSVIDDLKRDFPDYPRYQPRAWPKSYRDVGLVLRHCANAALRDDVRSLQDNLLAWLKTILAAFVFHSPKFVRDTYILLRAACRRELPAGSFALLEPCLDATVAVLPDFSEEFFDGPRPPAANPVGPTAADRAEG